MERMVALLRGINVGGNRKLPMSELRAIAAKLGWSDVETYIQSGNLVFGSNDSPLEAAQRLERALAKKLGFEIDVIVRTAVAWKKYAAQTAFPDAAAVRPHLLHLALCEAKPAPTALALLRDRASAGERIELVGDAFWIDYVSGVARSKLTPTLLDRASGSTVTARNHKTVLQLRDRLSPANP